MFKGITNRLKSSDFGLFLLITINNIYDTYKEIFKKWWLFGPFFVIAVGLINYQMPEFNFISRFFVLPLFYLAVRPSVEPKSSTYFLRLYAYLVLVCVILTQFIDTPSILLNFLIRQRIFKLADHTLLILQYMKMGYVWLASILSDIASPLYAFVCLFSADQVGLERISLRIFFNSLRFIFSNFFICFVPFFLWICLINVIDYGLAYFNVQHLFDIDWLVAVTLLFLPIMIVFWTNVYVKFVYSNPDKYIQRDV